MFSCITGPKSLLRKFPLPCLPWLLQILLRDAVKYNFSRLCLASVQPLSSQKTSGKGSHFSPVGPLPAVPSGLSTTGWINSSFHSTMPLHWEQRLHLPFHTALQPLSPCGKLRQQIYFWSYPDQAHMSLSQKTLSMLSISLVEWTPRCKHPDKCQGTGPTSRILYLSWSLCRGKWPIAEGWGRGQESFSAKLHSPGSLSTLRLSRAWALEGGWGEGRYDCLSGLVLLNLLWAVEEGSGSSSQ